MVNYNKISQIYDDVREADLELLNAMLAEISLTSETRMLDIGCGTGNYASLLQQMTRADVCGVEPSDGMREKAQAKNPNIRVHAGNAAQIPFGAAAFDVVYMTDVIHHVPDLSAMFAEIARVMRPAGKLCIATQSHAQIAARPYARFFPGVVAVDQQRYPDLDVIINAAEQQPFTCLKITVLYENRPTQLDEKFLELVEKKGYSMFHLISAEEYAHGLAALKDALRHGAIPATTAGESLIWFAKQ